MKKSPDRGFFVIRFGQYLTVTDVHGDFKTETHI